MIYSTAADVIVATGAKHEDLELDDDEALIAVVEAWLEEIKDLIDTYLRRDFHEEGAVPKGIDAIAKEMAAAAYGLALQRRQSPIIRVDEFTIRQVRGQLLTKEVKSDLKAYRSRGTSPFRMWRVRSAAEVEALEEDSV